MAPVPDIAAVELGEPAVGVTTVTVFADKLNAKLPVSVMMNLPLFGMALSGEKLRVSVTEDVA